MPDAPAAKALIANRVSAPINVPLLGRIDLLHHVLPVVLMWVALFVATPYSGFWGGDGPSLLNLAPGLSGLVWLVVGLLVVALVRTRLGERIAGLVGVVVVALAGGELFIQIRSYLFPTLFFSVVFVIWLILLRRPWVSLVLIPVVIGVEFVVSSWGRNIENRGFATFLSLLILTAAGVAAAAIWKERPDPAPRVVQPAAFASMPGQAQNGYVTMPTALALPTVTSTVLITFFFGVFGLIPATINANRAAQLGASGAPYWKAFGITFGAIVLIAVLFWIVVFAALRSATG